MTFSFAIPMFCTVINLKAFPKVIHEICSRKCLLHSQCLFLLPWNFTKKEIEVEIRDDESIASDSPWRASLYLIPIQQ